MAKSKAKILSEQFGGKWKYDGHMCGWYCDDQQRVVFRTCPGVDQFDNRLPGPPHYYLYQKGKTPIWVSFSRLILK